MVIVKRKSSGNHIPKKITNNDIQNLSCLRFDVLIKDNATDKVQKKIIFTIQENKKNKM